MDNNAKINAFIKECEQENKAIFEQIDDVALHNQEKVLNAFRDNKVALRHFSGSSGYGYEDEGKGMLSRVFATAFNTESAIVSPLLASGTHTISTALFGLLRPNDELLIASGVPYDTLVPVINGKDNGSLADYNVKHTIVPLLSDGSFDTNTILKKLSSKPKVLLMQRSRGYTWRNPLSTNQIAELVVKVKKISPNTIIVADNCYGEFTEKIEPTSVGVDVIMGSLIKNPGGGIADTGGYIAGKEIHIKQIENRLTAPGVGVEVGSYTSGYRTYFQGFFNAPHVTASALKGALLFSKAFSKLKYKTLPDINSAVSDIICSINFDTKEELIKFIQTIQTCSPVDSFATPYPWDMPGYVDQVIMAAGTFVQGASIELSADAPMREPYIAYIQGGLTYEHVKIAVKNCINQLNLM